MHLPGFLKAVEDWMRDSEDRAAGLTKAFLEMPDATTMLFNLFMVALIPAIGEELLFRGIVQRIFSSWSKNIHVGVWMAAFLFSAMHMQFYGLYTKTFIGSNAWISFVWSGVYGCQLPRILSTMQRRSFSLFLFQHRVSSIDVDTVGTKEGDVLSVPISLALTISLLYMIYKSESQKRLLSGNESLSLCPLSRKGFFFQFLLITKENRRGVRVVEGARLESV